MPRIKLAVFIGLCIGVVPLAVAKLTGSLSEEAIAERLKTVGTVKVEGAAARAAREQAAAQVGGPESIYSKNCKQCHKTGLSGAPKLGDKAAWEERIAAQGLDTLVERAWTGFKAMPPKGNCLKCSKEEIRATVEFMLDSIK